MKQFHAIDFFALLNALPREQVGEGAYIILTNVRGERQVWQRKQIEAYKPVIVIGIDDGRTFSGSAHFYRMFCEYSRKSGARTTAEDRGWRIEDRYLLSR